MKMSITMARLLLHQGLPFRGHDESENSHNKGNFLEFLNVYSKANEDMSRVVMKNAPKNLKMTCPDTQKDIANASAEEILKAITDDVGADLFGILVDESCDVSDKEQMAVLLRYVDKRGHVLERFIGIVHVTDTTALSLKEAISALLSSLNLSLSRVQRQSYDGASNMRGSFNGLKSLILRENSSAHYIHCFAHQLQLALVYVARHNDDANWFFVLLSQSCNIVGGSAKRRDLFREKQTIKAIEELSHALQRKDQDIENAMALVKVAKDRLQAMRDDGWTCLLDEVSSFCTKHEINIPNMDNRFVLQGKSARKAPHITHLHRYRVDIFCAIIDTQLQELNNRFDEINSELLLCMACLNTRDSFRAFDREKLVKLASFYPAEFFDVGLVAFSNKLENFIVDVRTMDKFSNLNGLSELASVMVKTNKHITHRQVFLLIKLALILPVATASVERVFSAMKIIKDNLRNKMCDQWMNDCLIACVEKELFEGVSDSAILRRF
ncbi:uncharacterized protein LOC144554485 [Carex rostrata]